MSSVHVLQPIISHLTAAGDPRLLYLAGSGTWVVANYDPFMANFGSTSAGSVISTEYATGDDALRALVAAGHYFNANSPTDVEVSNQILRSATVNLHRLPITAGENDFLTDTVLHDMLTVVATTAGDPMRGQRAIAELQAPAPAAATASPTHAVLDHPEFDPIDLPGGRQYWPRTVFGTNDVAFLQELRAAGTMHARLSGPPGSGKTTLVEAAFGDDVVTVQGHSALTVASLYGQYLPGGPTDPPWVWVDGPAVRAARDGKVLFIDEANRAPKDVDDALLSLTDKRRLIVQSDRPDLPPVQAASGFMVVVSYNHADTGIRALSASLLRRLAMHIRVDTDYSVAARLGVNDDLLQVASNLQTSGRRYGIDHDTEPSWYPQIADLEGAELMRAHGPQAMFTAMTASATDPTRIRDSTQVFASVFGVTVSAVAELGTTR